MTDRRRYRARSAKIAKLRDEGYPAKQAEAIAYREYGENPNGRGHAAYVAERRAFYRTIEQVQGRISGSVFVQLEALAAALDKGLVISGLDADRRDDAEYLIESLRQFAEMAWRNGFEIVNPRHPF